MPPNQSVLAYADETEAFPALIAYFNDFLRGYYISSIMSLAVFSLIWFGQPVYLIIAGLLIILPGVFMLVRFLNKYKLPPGEASHE